MNQPQLKRETFTTSRLMDFFSEKELITQIGHAVHEWPLVCLKELVDNSIDACEEAKIPPVISIQVDETGITVFDNGTGIPAETITNMLDFSIRVSSREAYVSPDRGAQGNALKTIVAMPFVLDGNQGRVEIHSQGIAHDILCKVDRIRQQPVIEHTQSTSIVKNGTRFVVHWPVLACSKLNEAKDHFLQIAESFTFLNPHLTLAVDWHGEVREWFATDPAWSSWPANNPTSAHWYTQEHLSRLIAAYLTTNPEKTVREFVSEFRGLKGTAKQKKILAATGISRHTLEFFVDDDDLDGDKIAALLDAMKEHSVAPAPKLLGVIGEKHFRSRCEELGCEMDSFGYQKKLGSDDGLPWVVEMAFAYRGENGHKRKLVAGVNWSAGIDNPFRKLGKFGQSMDTVLSDARAGDDEPIIMIMHMSCPRVTYSDRGKSSIVLEG